MLVVKNDFQDKYTGRIIKAGTIVEVEDLKRKEYLLENQLIAEAETIILKKVTGFEKDSITEVENEPKNMDEMTVKEIKAILDKKGIEYSPRDTKSELIKLLGVDK